jgi:hypothetical protein
VLNNKVASPERTILRTLPNKIERLENETNVKLKAFTYKGRFLEAGLVRYPKTENKEIEGSIPTSELSLIKSKNLLKIAESFKGAHVILEHQDIVVGENGERDNTDEIVGYINNVWFNSEDGWVWCDFTVNDEDTINLISKGFTLSCAYYPEYAQGGTYHNINYDHEIIGGEAIHLAIVDNPRYEEAMILTNSIQNKVKNMFKIKKEKKENSVQEIELSNAVHELKNGEIMSIANMIEIYRNNKEEEVIKVNADDEIEIDGKMVKVSELEAICTAAKKNAEEEKEKEEEAKKNAEEEEEKEKIAAKKNAEEEEEKAKEAAKKNAEEEEKKEKEAKEAAKKNCADAVKIKEARASVENGVEVEASKEIILDADRFALGQALYGKPKAASSVGENL